MTDSECNVTALKLKVVATGNKRKEEKRMAQLQSFMIALIIIKRSFR
jgi:hypothetical protein